MCVCVCVCACVRACVCACACACACVYFMCAGTSQTVDKYWQVIGFFLKDVLNPLLLSPLFPSPFLFSPEQSQSSPHQFQRVQRAGAQGSQPGSLHYLQPVVKHTLPFLQPTWIFLHLLQANYQHYHLIFMSEANRNDRGEEDERRAGRKTGELVRIERKRLRSEGGCEDEAWAVPCNNSNKRIL